MKVLQVENIREDFPILERKINGENLIYLDSAATSQKPIQVIEAVDNYYKTFNANVHRAVHTLSAEATDGYENTREKISKFINAKNSKEIIFTKNATEAINIVSHSYGENLKGGDEIVLSVMEHHSNIVPWQLLQKKGVKLKFVDINEDGTLRQDQIEELINNKTKLVAITHVSNVLGTINNIEEIVKISHNNGAKVLIDAAQSVPHMPVDVRKIDCDFLVFSAHKMLGPTGIGVLYGREEILENLQPFLLGSDQIKEVGLTETTFTELPWKFETGTPNIAGTIGFSAAIDYLNKVGMENIWSHEKELTRYALEKMKNVGKLKIFGPVNGNRAGVVSFNMADVHSHDLASVLDRDGIAIRSGHHCAMPLMKRLGVSAVARASFYLYNTKEEIDRFVESLEKSKQVFKI